MKANALLIQAVAAMISVGFALPVHAMSEADVLRACYALDATPPAQRYFECVGQEAVRLEASGADPAEVAEAATVTTQCVASYDLVRQTPSLCASYIASAPTGLLMPWTAPDFEKLARAHALDAILSKRLAVSAHPAAQ